MVTAFDGGTLTSDAGSLLLGATDRAIRLVERFATCFTDQRSATLIEHKVATLVGQRVFGIALGGACPRAGEAGPGEGRTWRSTSKACARPTDTRRSSVTARAPLLAADEAMVLRYGGVRVILATTGLRQHFRHLLRIRPATSVDPNQCVRMGPG